MNKLLHIALSLLIVSIGTAPALAQHKPEVIERGKKATALVEVTTAKDGAYGSAFCIDTSGLFITNAHVVRQAAGGEGQVRLVVDIGRKTQRSLRAKVLRADDALDLALLKVDADLGLTPLALGQDDALIETAPILTFGFPLAKRVTVRNEAYPDVTVLPSRITALRRDKGQLEGIQFDGQLNPGNSGGAVVDDAGRVIGVAVATIRGAAMNLAIPVSRLAEFLAAPGLVFEPPTLLYKDRNRQVTWTIKVQPAMPGAKLPEKLSIDVTVANGGGAPRSFTAQPAGDGVFRVKVTPVPGDPDRKVNLDARFPNGQSVQVEVKDGDVKVGDRKFLLSDLQSLQGGALPRATTSRGQLATGPIIGLGKVKRRVGNKTVTIDLNGALQIAVRPLDPPPPVQAVEVLVEVKQGSKVLATVHKRADLSGAPESPQAPAAVAVRAGPNIVIIPIRPPAPARSQSQGPSDDGLLQIGGALDVDGTPRGAGQAIRPPQVAIGAARVGNGSEAAGEIRRFVGHSNVLWSVAISRDGRRLLTASHDSTVRLRDVETGTQLRVFQGHTAHVKGVAFLPDGRRGLSGADDDIMILWDLETGRELRRYVGHTADLSSVAVSPDGRRALTGANDRTVRLWDVETGRELRRLDGHTAEVTDVAFLPDGRRGLSAGLDGTVRLWDLETGRELRRLDGHTGRMICVAVSPDGRLALAGGDDGIVRVWEVESGREVVRLTRHDDSVEGVAVTPDGRRAVSTGWGKDQTVRIWEIASGRQIRCLRGFQSGMSSVAVTPDGRSVAVGVGSTAQLWGLPDRDAPPEESGEPLVRTLGGTIRDVAVGGGGRYLILPLTDARKLAVFDVNAADVVKTIPLPSENALVAAGAKVLVIAYPDEGLFQRWDLETMARQGASVASPIQGRLKGLALGSDSDGPLLAVWSPEAGRGAIDQARFSFLDLQTFRVLKAGPISTGGFQGIGSVSPSGGSVLLHPFLRERVHVRASAGGGLFAIWQTNSSPTGFQTLKVREGALRAIYNHEALDHLAPGPDGATIYTGRGGPRDPEGKPLRRTESAPGSPSELTIPTPSPAYYLRIGGLAVTPNAATGASPITASVHAAGDGHRLLTVRDLGEMAGAGKNESGLQDDLSVEKRFHLVPAAQLLITIPPSNDRLVLRRLDIAKVLEKQGTDYLLVTSPAAVSAAAGQEFRHQVAVESRKGSVTYSVTSGPEGLAISAAGEVTWRVVPKYSGEEEVVVLTIGDASGQEIFHTLRIRVR